MSKTLNCEGSQKLLYCAVLRDFSLLHLSLTAKEQTAICAVVCCRCFCCMHLSYCAL